MSDYPENIEALMEMTISGTLAQLRRMGGENTKLVVREDVYDIETALRDYRDDLIMAFNETVKFNDDYYLKDNMDSFLIINLYDLGLLSTVHAPDCSTPRSQNWRAMQRSPKTIIRISNLMSAIYSAVMRLKNLEYREIIN